MQRLLVPQTRLVPCALHLRLLSTSTPSPPPSGVVYLAPDGSLHPPTRARTSPIYVRGRPAFVDRVRLSVRAGDGGSGAALFSRMPNMERAPPDGGRGGAGGSVWLRADAGVSSLRMSERHLRAESGARGRGGLRAGGNGEDVVLRVPPGTVVRVAGEDPRAGEVLCDLARDGMRAMVAGGGKGGRGNAAFKSGMNRSPSRAEMGGKGDVLVVDLELKSIADVGLVGLPNAGKSTLLCGVSRARPKVAEYPFTTLRPHIGVVERGERRMTVADIPGLIEGAHENRGLGHEFLRHVERTAVLVYVLDMSAPENCGRKGLDMLMRELDFYEPGLSKRPACIAANKMDSGMEAVTGLRQLLHDVGDTLPIFPMCAREGAGTDDLVDQLLGIVDGVKERASKMGGESEGAIPASAERHDGEVLTGTSGMRAITV